MKGGTTEKKRARQKRYDQSEKGRDRHARYEQTENGRMRKARYEEGRIRVRIAGLSSSYRVPPKRKDELLEKLGDFRSRQADDYRKASSRFAARGLPRAAMHAQEASEA